MPVPETAVVEAPAPDLNAQNFAELAGEFAPEPAPSAPASTEVPATPAGEPAAAVAEGEVEGQATELQPQPTVAAPPTPPATFQYKGRTYTSEEIARDADLLRSVLTTAEQFPHLQQKYVETLEASRIAREPQPAPQPAQRATPDEIRHATAPLLSAAVKDGFIEDSFVEVFPNAASQMAFYASRVDQGTQLIQSLVERLNKYEMRETAERVKTGLNNTLDDMAKSDEIFKPLETPEVRTAFLNYLRELNPMADQVTRDFLDRQYLAFHSRAIYEARRAEKAKVEADLKLKRGRAAGAGAGARPSAPIAAAADPKAQAMEELIGDLLPPARR